MPGLTLTLAQAWPASVAHALAENGDLVRVFLTPHLGDRADNARRQRIARLVMDAQAAAGRIDFAEHRELPRHMHRRLSIVPLHDTDLVHKGLVGRFGQPAVAQQLGVAVLA